jgi:squalene synthase HpnC
MSVNHYENFPVASILLPARLRPAVKAIYVFARSADDIADEGDASPQERLDALSRYENALDSLARGEAAEASIFANLAKTKVRYNLPLQPLRDLLSAFKQDVVTTRYADFEALLDYCRRSANPVGRLMLHLYDAASPANLWDADAICTSLQLINFWQDVAVDWKKSRIYLPLEDLKRFGVTTDYFENAKTDDAWRALMRFEVERARAMMLSGAPLACRLPGRVGWELRLVVQGGLRILERIEAADYDMFRRRPQLRLTDWLYMIGRALRMKIRLSHPTQLR